MTGKFLQRYIIISKELDRDEIQECNWKANFVFLNYFQRDFTLTEVLFGV